MNKIFFKERLLQGFIILFLLFFPHYVPLPFYSYAIVCMVVMLIYLKTKGKNLGDLGLKRALTFKAVAIGLISALLWIAFNKWVYHPFITHFFDVPDYTEYDFIRKKLSNLILTIIAAWVVGGLYEEIVFRGFIQTTLQHWFQKQNHPFWIAGIITSILFGLYHWQQGIFGMVPAFLGGLLWTFLLYRYKGNLWYPILSHAIYDTVALILIYNNIVI
ncbi:MAG TPA: type II CAAX endopeptidase family protein [Hanamia sp.]|jgi:membrane protease YdiL (CAAX protease family)|nr:type II CAAX endopeptidase family protein [Hanamia sp.]